MPSSINFQGGTVYRPGTYGIVDASALSASGLTNGNVCVVGNFPHLEQLQLATFIDADDLTLSSPKDSLLALLADYGFNPLQTGGSPTSISLLNVQPNTQASLNIGSGVEIKSGYFGTRGNSLSLSIKNNGVTTSANGAEEAGLSIVLTDNKIGANNPYDAIIVDFEKLCKLTSATTLDTLTVSFSSSTGLFSLDFSDTDTIATQKDYSIPVATGLLTCPSNASAYTVTVSGKDKAGNALEQTFNVVAGGAVLDLGADFGFVSLVNPSVDNLSFTFAGKMMSEDATQYADFNSLLKKLEGAEFANVLTGFSLLTQKSYSYSDIDDISAATIKATTVKVTAFKGTLVNAINNSGLPIIAEKLSAAYDYAALADGVTDIKRFTGGSESASALSDWQDGFESLYHKNVQIVIPYTSTLAIQQALRDSFKAAVGQGGSEKNGWVGASDNQTLEQLSSGWVNQLNDKNIALVGQQVVIVDPITSLNKTMPCIFTAFMMGCAQAALGIAVPQTRKQLRIVDTKENWKREQDVEKAIKRSIVVMSALGNNPLRIERSVTTYRVDSNPIFSEVSANDSVNSSIRDLRQAVESQIGDAITSNKLLKVTNVVENRLLLQRANGIIKNFKDVKIRQNGDSFLVSYSVAAVEPLNFIIVTANVGRF